MQSTQVGEQGPEIFQKLYPLMVTALKNKDAAIFLE